MAKTRSNGKNKVNNTYSKLNRRIKPKVAVKPNQNAVRERQKPAKTNNAAKPKRVWSSSNIESLLHLMYDYSKDLTSKNRRHAHVYSKISEELSRQGLEFSDCDVKDKISQLNRRYKTERKAHCTTGSSPSNWEYFNLMQQIFPDTSVVLPECFDSVPPLCVAEEPITSSEISEIEVSDYNDDDWKVEEYVYSVENDGFELESPVHDEYIDEEYLQSQEIELNEERLAQQENTSGNKNNLDVPDDHDSADTELKVKRRACNHSWTENETRALLQQMKNNCIHLERKKYGQVYCRIATAMQEVGMPFNEVQVKSKVAALKRRFKGEIASNTNWKHFKAMKSIFPTLDSGKSSERQGDEDSNFEDSARASPNDQSNENNDQSICDEELMPQSKRRRVELSGSATQRESNWSFDLNNHNALPLPRFEQSNDLSEHEIEQHSLDQNIVEPVEDFQPAEDFQFQQHDQAAMHQNVADQRGSVPSDHRNQASPKIARNHKVQVGDTSQSRKAPTVVFRDKLLQELNDANERNEYHATESNRLFGEIIKFYEKLS